MAKCCFVLVGAHEPGGPVYCGKPVGYTMPRDDDGRRVRKPNTLCDDHQRWVDAHPDADDEEDE